MRETATHLFTSYRKRSRHPLVVKANTRSVWAGAQGEAVYFPWSHTRDAVSLYRLAAVFSPSTAQCFVLLEARRSSADCWSVTLAVEDVGSGRQESVTAESSDPYSILEIAPVFGRLSRLSEADSELTVTVSSQLLMVKSSTSCYFADSRFPVNLYLQQEGLAFQKYSELLSIESRGTILFVDIMTEFFPVFNIDKQDYKSKLVPNHSAQLKIMLAVMLWDDFLDPLLQHYQQQENVYVAASARLLKGMVSAYRTLCSLHGGWLANHLVEEACSSNRQQAFLEVCKHLSKQFKIDKKLSELYSVVKTRHKLFLIQQKRDRSEIERTHLFGKSEPVEKEDLLKYISRRINDEKADTLRFEKSTRTLHSCPTRTLQYRYRDAVFELSSVWLRVRQQGQETEEYERLPKYNFDKTPASFSFNLLLLYGETFSFYKNESVLYAVALDCFFEGGVRLFTIKNGETNHFKGLVYKPSTVLLATLACLFLYSLGQAAATPTPEKVSLATALGDLKPKELLDVARVNCSVAVLMSVSQQQAVLVSSVCRPSEASLVARAVDGDFRFAKVCLTELHRRVYAVLASPLFVEVFFLGRFRTTRLATKTLNPRPQNSQDLDLDCLLVYHSFRSRPNHIQLLYYEDNSPAIRSLRLRLQV